MLKFFKFVVGRYEFMSLQSLKDRLEPGMVYRRSDLEKWSSAIDRHLVELQNEGTLEKVAPGMYYYPKRSAFGKVPPSDHVLVRSYLKDDDFLLTSFNDYNKLQVGTTQLYNKTTVYNHKRQGEVKLGNRNFFFQIKPKYPKEVTVAYLLVELVNNLDSIAEDPDTVLRGVHRKVYELPLHEIRHNLEAYGSARAKYFFNQLLSA